MIIGRLTRDPEARTTPQGTAVSSFSVATGFVWTDQQGQKQEKTEFHNVVAWRKLAEICNQYLKKASKVYIEGRLQTRSWNDPSGVTKYRTEIIADSMIMLDTRPASGGFPPSQSASGAGASKVSSATPASPGDAAPASGVGEVLPPPADDNEIKIENIPF